MAGKFSCNDRGLHSLNALFSSFGALILSLPLLRQEVHTGCSIHCLQSSLSSYHSKGSVSIQNIKQTFMTTVLHFIISATRAFLFNFKYS